MHWRGQKGVNGLKQLKCTKIDHIDQIEPNFLYKNIINKKMPQISILPRHRSGKLRNWQGTYNVLAAQQITLWTPHPKANLNSHIDNINNKKIVEILSKPNSNPKPKFPDKELGFCW